MPRSFRLPKKPKADPPIEGQQLTMFGGRQLNGPTVSQFGNYSFCASTTWMLRRAHMDDFKVRAACRHKPFRERHVYHDKDADGDYTQWVFEYRKGPDGDYIRDKEGRHPQQFHVRGPDGQNLKRKRVSGEYIFLHDPPYEEFPSHKFSSFDRRYVVTGDDGTTWAVGSRGNDLAMLRQEVVNNPVLWPEEKDEVLRWLDGPRKLVVEPGSPPGEAEEVDRIVRWVDHYFCQRIMGGLPVTEEEIEQSGLDEKYVENLVHNLRNYVPYRRDDGQGAPA